MTSLNQAPYAYFKSWAHKLFAGLQSSEELVLSFFGEETQFLRFNQSLVRQTGLVEQFEAGLSFICQKRSFEGHFTLTGHLEKDVLMATQALEKFRNSAPALPEDPYIVYPQNNGVSQVKHQGTQLPLSQVPDCLLKEAKGHELVGLYTAGKVYRGSLNSRGQDHFFETDQFNVDFSIHLENGQATKGLYAGTQWSQDEYLAELYKLKQESQLLARPVVQVTKGEYRVYLGPQAHAELLGTLAWGGLSFRALKQGSCALARLSQKETSLSPKISLKENFELGLAPSFNELGEVSPSQLTLIEKGQLKNLLVGSRAAQEYSVKSNGASDEEYPRTLELSAGDLEDKDILKRLDTGLYLANLHYLNWSDRNAARVTGMTRYACFWVEKGEMVGPISNLRFDDSFYRIWGNQLEDLTVATQVIPHTSTYFRRSLGGVKVPGALLKGLQFTL